MDHLFKTNNVIVKEIQIKKLDMPFGNSDVIPSFLKVQAFYRSYWKQWEDIWEICAVQCLVKSNPAFLSGTGDTVPY